METPGRFAFSRTRLAFHAGHMDSKKIAKGLSLLGIGAAGMYFFDPKMGHRRRAMARDQVRHYRREASKRMAALSRDLTSRTKGLIHQASLLVIPEFLQRSPVQPSDETLKARALSRVGRVPHHEPRTFDIQAHDGCIMVTGEIDDGDYQRLYRALRKIPGVKKVERKAEIGNGQVAS
jgi:hypothetical protein